MYAGLRWCNGHVSGDDSPDAAAPSHGEAEASVVPVCGAPSSQLAQFLTDFLGLLLTSEIQL